MNPLEKIQSMPGANEILSQLLKPDIEYRFVPNYENMYVITNYGDIISFRFGKLKILKHIRLKTGYHFITMYTLTDKHKRRGRLVAHLLLEAFNIQRPDSSHVVHYKDGNKNNLHISNLEWSTRSDVMKAGHKAGRFNVRKNVEVYKDGEMVMSGTSGDIAHALKLSASLMKVLREHSIEWNGYTIVPR